VRERVLVRPEVFATAVVRDLGQLEGERRGRGGGREGALGGRQPRQLWQQELGGTQDGLLAGVILRVRVQAPGCGGWG
jgi:hypothetical protein